MLKGRRWWVLPNDTVPDESKTPMMFVVEDGEEYIGWYDPEAAEFFTSGLMGPVERFPASIVGGWRPIMREAKEYIAKLRHRREDEARRKRIHEEEEEAARERRKDVLLDLGLGESISSDRGGATCEAS